jgi:O-antigen ligase
VPARVVESLTADVRRGNCAVALLVATVILLAVIPEAINQLLVKRTPDLSPLESAGSESMVANLARWAGSAVLLSLSSIVVMMRGHPNREISRVLLLLLALNLPYIVGPKTPGMADLIKIVLANLFILAIWNAGSSIVQLKWLPIVVSAVGVYSIVGGLVIPEYMMYNIVSRKALIAGWELAGPFGHGNVLGMYCAVAFALVPLIDGVRWRLLCGSILFATMVASASRTALIASSLVVLWWLVCWFRSTVSVRLAGTVLVSCTAAAMFVFPFVDWDPDAFTDRAFIWEGGLRVWQQSPVVGMGFNWFLTDAQLSAEPATWASAGTGHNLVVDTLVRSGLAGLAVVAPLFVVALFVTRRLRINSQQMACFGYLMAIFVLATTEAVWDLWPNSQLFPISGLIFAVLIMARTGDRGEEGPP